MAEATEPTDTPAGAPPVEQQDDSTDWKSEARKWETRAKKSAADASAAAEKAREKTLTESEKAIEAARKEAAETARSEAATAYQQRLASAELRAAAGGRLKDPADAARFIDLADLEFDKNGDLDSKAATAAVDRLLKEKPYLAQGVPQRGTADGGNRGGTPPGDMNSLIRQAAGHR